MAQVTGTAAGEGGGGRAVLGVRSVSARWVLGGVVGAPLRRSARMRPDTNG